MVVFGVILDDAVTAGFCTEELDDEDKENEKVLVPDDVVLLNTEGT